MTTNHTTERRSFSNLKKLYLLALSGIALSIIFSQGLIQSFLGAHQGDAQEVNIAGRQRMFSQKLTKQVLQLSNEPDSTSYTTLRTELSKTINAWSESHETLVLSAKEKHPVDIQSLYEKLGPHYKDILQSAVSVSNSKYSAGVDKSDVQQILKNEPQFLKSMDVIVNTLEQNAEKKVRQLQRLELILLVVALLIILLEIIFLFRPTSIKIDQTIEDLNESKTALQASNETLSIANLEKKKAYDQLNTLNNAIEQAVLFAFLDERNNTIYVSSELKNTLKFKGDGKNQSFLNLIKTTPIAHEQIKTLINQSKTIVTTEDIYIGETYEDITWLELTIIPISNGVLEFRKMVLVNDISERKEIQRQLDKINADRFEGKIKEQQLTSLLVIEAQEAERKRIARDLHDGIGQTLTALKFSVESINTDSKEETDDKINLIKNEVKRLIREVRFTSFNLTPPELVDYGLETAIETLITQLNNVSNIPIHYINLSNQSDRFDTLVETNLYRIVQEAVNNAIKYSSAEMIQIKYQHTSDMLSISVIDNGQGFDMAEYSNKDRKEKGMGLRFMEERVKYLKGRMFRNSIVGSGTTITVNIPNENLYLTPVEDRMKSL